MRRKRAYRRGSKPEDSTGANGVWLVPKSKPESQGATPVTSHRAGVATNVGGQDRRQFALLTGHGRFPRCLQRIVESTELQDNREVRAKSILHRLLGGRCHCSIIIPQPQEVAARSLQHPRRGGLRPPRPTKSPMSWQSGRRV